VSSNERRREHDRLLQRFEPRAIDEMLRFKWRATRNRLGELCIEYRWGVHPLL
jgi:hypothetical protein